jgi:putative serine protease PepD
MPQPTLISTQGQSWPLSGIMSVGRAAGSAITVNDPSVSSNHARIEVYGQQVFIADLGSSNGTLVNGQRISQNTQIYHRDRLRLGIVEFTLDIPQVMVTPTPIQPTPIQPTPIQPTPHTVFASVPSGPRTVMRQSAAPLMLVKRDGVEYPISGTLIIGRDSTGSGLAFPGDSKLSAHHARLDVMPHDQVQLTDLGSSNGTWLNGKRVQHPQILKHGDLIIFGDTTLRLRVAGQPFEALAAPTRSFMPLMLGLAAFVVLMGGGLFWYIQQNQTHELSAAAIAQAQKSAMLILNLDSSGSTQSTGSGTVINSSGLILTNFHVIENASGLLAAQNLDNPESTPNHLYTTQIVASSKEYDLAIIKIIAKLEKNGGDMQAVPLNTGQSFAYLRFGDSTKLKQGDQITTFGFPGIGGNTLTLTKGTVSGYLDDDENSISNGWMKTDAEINPGNSGGTTVNSNGELVGIPTMVADSGGGRIGYVRPSVVAKKFLQENKISL